MHARMMQMMKGGMMQGHAGMHVAMAGEPTMPGQDAFGAIQEVVQILEADPTTDWSKVNIAALRQHLIDMNEVTLHAVAAERAFDSGIEITVTGEGRTLEAIKRMVPAHASELTKIGWNAKTDDLPNGVKLTVTSSDPKQVIKLKALGFMGIMVQGARPSASSSDDGQGRVSHALTGLYSGAGPPASYPCRGCSRPRLGAPGAR